ncbi:MAG: gliding motility protein GldC [Phycisphaerales bacterium]|nr:gliding motility protein GldC [Phycisphaerales bacterium]
MKSDIIISVTLDDQKLPVGIEWKAENSTISNPQQAKAMNLSFWDGQEKTAMRMDMWTKGMMINEMEDFYFQTFMSMADSFEKATQQKELANDIKSFAQSFLQKIKSKKQS